MVQQAMDATYGANIASNANGNEDANSTKGVSNTMAPVERIATKSDTHASCHKDTVSSMARTATVLHFTRRTVGIALHCPTMHPALPPHCLAVPPPLHGHAPTLPCLAPYLAPALPLTCPVWPCLAPALPLTFSALPLPCPWLAHAIHARQADTNCKSIVEEDNVRYSIL